MKIILKNLSSKSITKRESIYICDELFSKKIKLIISLYTTLSMNEGNWKCSDSDWMRNVKMCKCARLQKGRFQERLMARAISCYGVQ